MNAADGTPARRPRRVVDGVVLVDKPAGITSNAALQRVKRAFNADKAGHTGTLDPLATGLLPICFGEATKFSAALLDADKGYRATIELGVTTDTGDREGTVIATREAPTDLASIERALDGFRGEILQRPHRYSAIKRDGRALYHYAREGIEVDVAPRAVRIVALEVDGWEPPFLSIDVLCSKGTYIRSLAEDIGGRLGCGAHVAALRRTRVGHLGLAAAFTLESIESMPAGEIDRLLRPVSLLVEALAAVELDEAEAAGFLNGRRTPIAPDRAPMGGPVAVGRRSRPGDPGFLGLATVADDGTGAVLVPSRVIASRWRQSAAEEAVSPRAESPSTAVGERIESRCPTAEQT